MAPNSLSINNLPKYDSSFLGAVFQYIAENQVVGRHGVGDRLQRESVDKLAHAGGGDGADVLETGVMNHDLTRVDDIDRGVWIRVAVETGGRVNLERSADYQDEVGLSDQVDGRLHLGDSLAEKDDVGPVLRSVGGEVAERDALIAAVHHIALAEAVEFVAGILRPDLGYFSVEMDDVGTSGALMEIVDILGNYIDRIFRLQFSYQPVGFVGLNVAEMLPLHVIEIEHEAGVARPAFC